jgi:hypothetical protein
MSRRVSRCAVVTPTRVAAGGFAPRVTWHDSDGTIHIVDGPDAFTTWREAEEASRFLASGSVNETTR